MDVHTCPHTYVHAEGDITSAGLLLEKGANGKYYLIAPHIEDPDEQGMYNVYTSSSAALDSRWVSQYSSK